MNYVFLNIKTTGLDYKKDELIFIECQKYNKEFKEIDHLKLYIKPQNKISKYIEKLTKIANQQLDMGYDLKESIKKLKLFLNNCHIICFNAVYSLSFLLTALYKTKIDISFWYLELFTLFQEKIHYDSIKQLFKLYNIDDSLGFYKYIQLTKKYMKENHISDLDELTKEKPRNWNIIFRGINYPEYIGDYSKYTFYIADLSKDKYISYLSCLKEIRREDFTLEELKNLKKNNAKILVNILQIDEEIIKITNDYYIISYGAEINLNEKWGREYIEKLNCATEFIINHNEKLEITCYDTIKELDTKTKLVDKKIMDIIKSKIVREKQKWSRWN